MSVMYRDTLVGGQMGFSYTLLLFFSVSEKKKKKKRILSRFIWKINIKN